MGGRARDEISSKYTNPRSKDYSPWRMVRSLDESDRSPDGRNAEACEKTAVSRKAYRDGWDRIWGGK